MSRPIGLTSSSSFIMSYSVDLTEIVFRDVPSASLHVFAL